MKLVREVARMPETCGDDAGTIYVEWCEDAAGCGRRWRRRRRRRSGGGGGGGGKQQRQ